MSDVWSAVCELSNQRRVFDGDLEETGAKNRAFQAEGGYSPAELIV